MKQFWQNLLARQQENLREEGGLSDASAPQGTGSRKWAKTRLDKDLMENMVKIRAFTQNTTDLLERGEGSNPDVRGND